ncbi:Chaperone protein HtpG [compost metagenome]
MAASPAGDTAFRTDAVQLLLDQARVLDGDKPQDPRGFAERLSRVFDRALKA